MLILFCINILKTAHFSQGYYCDDSDARGTSCWYDIVPVYPPPPPQFVFSPRGVGGGVDPLITPFECTTLWGPLSLAV